MSSDLRILVSTGEPSGDLHAAPVVRSLQDQLPGLQVDALGGTALEKAGALIRYPASERGVLGLAEILSSIPRHLALLRKLGRDFRAGRYHLLLAVDYPGFNLRLAERARQAGVPVLYYIPPKHWATRSRLTPRLGRAVNRLACIIPFEPDFFRRFGIPAEYVGHPLLDRPPPPSREEARRRLGLSPAGRVLALFPGSRAQEVERHWPRFREAGRLLLAGRKCDRIVVAGLPGMGYPDPGPIQVIEDRSCELMAAADAGLVKSGTTTLEAALTGMPMVVAYRVHPLTAAVARRLLLIPWISLVNLIAEAPVVPELLQEQAEPERLAAAITPLLEPGSTAAGEQQVGFTTVRTRLGGPGAAQRVAFLARGLLQGAG